MKKGWSPFSSDENRVHFDIHMQFNFLCHNK